MDTVYPITRGDPALNKKPSFKDRLPKLPLFVWLVLLFALALLFSAGIYIAVNPNISLKSLFSRLTGGKQEELKNIWEPPPTTTPPPFGTGKQTYLVSGGTTGLPHITEIELDPVDPATGANQTLSAKAVNDTPIKELIITLHTDKGDTQMPPLQLSSGTNTDGVWKGTWKFDFSFNLTYRITAVAKNESNLGSAVTITLR